jgi:hypothetical protein
MKDIYFLHIPKTGGNYILSKLIEPIIKIYNFDQPTLNHISPKGHYGWGPAGGDQWIISATREPIRRLVSQYSAFTERYEIEREISRDAFMKWVTENEKLVSNLQAKNFLFERDADKNNFPRILDGADIEINNEILYARLRRVNVLLRDNQLNDKTLEDVKNTFLVENNLPHQHYIRYLDARPNKNHHSYGLYQSLTPEDIEYLKSIHNVDYAIYMDNSLYWNNGQ